MWKDEIIEEVRRARHDHAAKFGNDLAAIFADLRKQQRESGHKVVTLPPKRPLPRRTPGGVQEKPVHLPPIRSHTARPKGRAVWSYCRDSSGKPSWKEGSPRAPPPPI